MGRRGAGSIPATSHRDGATGIDGVTAADYEKDLEANLESLLNRIKSGSYRAPPVRRHYIPKADGTKRPLGIPTFEDKVAQRAILMLLEPIYETGFLPCSYGFRRGRSAHDALSALRKGIIEQRQRWVIDADISKYFDSITHSHLRSFLDLRIKDGVARRMIDKWLKAGVLEEDALHRPVAGTPQGGVISPMLSNVYLHHVLDEWFENVAKPRLHGRCQLVRFADDFVIALEDRHSGKRMLDVLGKRLGRYGLTLHETKTRYVDFRRRRPYGRHWMASATTFDFLGFTHVWGRSMQGKDVVRQITAKGRFARALKSVHEWCKRHRHLPIRRSCACGPMLAGPWRCPACAPRTTQPAAASCGPRVDCRSQRRNHRSAWGSANRTTRQESPNFPSIVDIQCGEKAILL